MNPKTITATTALEAGILGAVMLRPETLSALPTLETDDFFDPRNRLTWSAIRNCEATGIPIDVVTITAEIARWNGHGDSVTMEYLGGLMLDVPDTENAIEYARQLRQFSIARRVTVALGEVLSQAKTRALDGGELLSMAHEALSRIDEDQPDSAQPIASLLKRRIGQLEVIAAERAKGGSTLTGFPTGVAKLDEKIGGVQPGIVTIVAARPAMGKSSLGLSIADGASSGGFGVHVFSLEDTEEAYSDRTISRSSQVPAESLRNAQLNRQQASDLSAALGRFKGRRWLVDGRSGITADEIVRSVRRHRRQNATSVVIVDYIQLVKRPPRMSAHEALGEIITTLADAAKHDRLAYVVMSQLNRQIESRQDKRPLLSDLRESGSLEERAKCVIGLYRGAVYGGPVKGVDFEQGEAPPSATEHAAQVQLHVLKNSNGRTGHVVARWNGPTTRIS